MNIKTCPTCGSCDIRKVRRKWIGESQGKKYTVPALEYYICPNCGEKVYGPQAIRKIEAYSPTFIRKHAERKIA